MHWTLLMDYCSHVYVCMRTIMCVCMHMSAFSYMYYHEISRMPHLYIEEDRCHWILYGIFNVFVMWLSLKMLCSEVLVLFASHHYFLASQ